MITPIEPGTPSRSPEHDHPDQHRQQWRCPARDRVDDRQIAAPIRRGQQDEIGRLDEPGRDAQHDTLDRQGRTRPCAHHTANPSGTIPTDAANIPIVAARSGSPAVLSRTFQARWSTADTATRAMTQGSTPGRYLPMSRRVKPTAQSARPPTTMTVATTIPTGSKMPAIGWPRCL